MEIHAVMGSGVLSVLFGPETCQPSADVAADCVLDLDGLGRVVGLEMLGLASLVGSKPLPGYDVRKVDGESVLGCAYDREADALYIKLAVQPDAFAVTLGMARSLDQRTAPCKLVIDNNGRLMRIDVEIRG